MHPARHPQTRPARAPEGTIPVSIRLLLLALASGIPAQVTGQVPPDQRPRVLAVVDSALAAITREDMAALADLMLAEALTFPVAQREGVTRYRVRTRADTRAGVPKEEIVERGFEAEVRVSGPLAMVWLPYDLYVNGQWSHCGVDAFSLIRVESGWRIAHLAFTVEQPPACRAHPDGPPRA